MVEKTFLEKYPELKEIRKKLFICFEDMEQLAQYNDHVNFCSREGYFRWDEIEEVLDKYFVRKSALKEYMDLARDGAISIEKQKVKEAFLSMIGFKNISETMGNTELYRIIRIKCIFCEKRLFGRNLKFCNFICINKYNSKIKLKGCSY